MIARRNRIFLAQVLIGVVLLCSVLCPCKANRSHAVEAEETVVACCSHCQKEQAPKEEPTDSEDCGCDSGCCALFVVPQKDGVASLELDVVLDPHVPQLEGALVEADTVHPQNQNCLMYFTYRGTLTPGLSNLLI